MHVLLPKVSGISYRRYQKIDMQKFCDNLANISVLSPASIAADLYDQYIYDLGCLIDRSLPLICGRIKKEPAGWLSYTYRKAKSVRRQFEHIEQRQVSAEQSQITHTDCPV